MNFSWDPNKEKGNRKKHKVSFFEASLIFADRFILTLFDDDHSENEDRWISIGKCLCNRLLVVIHTYQKSGDKEIIRILSARKASQTETKQYLERSSNL